MSAHTPRRRRALVAAATVVISTAACARGTATGGSGTHGVDAGGASAADTLVRLERGPCRGGCPAYVVALRGDGRVTYEGTGGGAPAGAHEARVPAADVRRLVAAIGAANFASLPTTYAMGTPGCGPYAADAPTVVLTLRTATATHAVRHDHGCADAPAVLTRLEQAIDSVARVPQWLASRSGGAR